MVLTWRRILRLTHAEQHRTGENCDIYDTRCYFNERSKADISQLNLPHGKMSISLRAE